MAFDHRLACVWISLPIILYRMRLVEFHWRQEALSKGIDFNLNCIYIVIYHAHLRGLCILFGGALMVRLLVANQYRSYLRLKLRSPLIAHYSARFLRRTQSFKSVCTCSLNNHALTPHCLPQNPHSRSDVTNDNQRQSITPDISWVQQLSLGCEGSQSL